MPDDSPSSKWLDFIKENINSTGDFAAFLIGSSIGVVVDIASANVTLSQGLVFGGSAGLGVKKALQNRWERRQLRKYVRQQIKYYKGIEDEAKAKEFMRLENELSIVKLMPVEEIKQKIKAIKKAGG